MKISWKNAVFGSLGALLLGFLLFWNIQLHSKISTLEEAEEESVEVPDTTVTSKTYTVEKIVKNKVPKAIYTFKKDTLLRDSVEKKDIITFIRYDPKKKLLQIEKITPSGLPVLNDFTIKDLQDFQIDGTGTLSTTKKKKKRKGLKIAAATAGVLLTGVLIYKLAK